MTDEAVQTHAIDEAEAYYHVDVLDRVLVLMGAVAGSYSWEYIRKQCLPHHPALEQAPESSSTSSAQAVVPVPSSTVSVPASIVRAADDRRCDDLVGSSGPSEPLRGMATTGTIVPRSAPELESMSHAELLAFAKLQQQEIQGLTKQVARAKTKVANALHGRKRALEQKQYHAKRARQSKDNLTAVHLEASSKRLRRGKKGNRYFTIRGGLSLAIKRSLSNAGAHAIGIISELDVTRQSICRWEIWLRAALLSAARRFHMQNQASLWLSDADQDGWRFQVHSVRGDATNAAVWQKQKVRCNENHSYYIVDPVTASMSWEVVRTHIQERRTLGSLQVVHDKTGFGCHALATKQTMPTA